MSQLDQKSTRPADWKRAVLVGVTFTVLGLSAGYAASRWSYGMWGASMKLRGHVTHCGWNRIWSMESDILSLVRVKEAYESRLRVIQVDEALGIELISAPKRNYWIRQGGDRLEGKELLAWLLAEQEWRAAQRADPLVQPGDIVIDCGAHVGVFTQVALDAGAVRVIALDPDPTQVECLKRNFTAETAAGKVTVIPKGVWRSEGHVTLSVGAANSGASSLVLERGGETIDVPVTTIDQVVQDLGLSRVDFIKLDIEGAEREALRGSVRTLTVHHPRILVDTNNRPDDAAVVPEVIKELCPGCVAEFGSCEPVQDANGFVIVPHFVVFR